MFYPLVVLERPSGKQPRETSRRYEEDLMPFVSSATSNRGKIDAGNQAGLFPRARAGGGLSPSLV